MGLFYSSGGVSITPKNINVAEEGGGGDFSPDDLPELYAWYRADTGAYTDAGKTALATNGQFVYVWEDKSGNGYDLTQSTGADRPTFLTGQVNGEPVLGFGPSDHLEASTASDWNFLHDGTENSVFIVYYNDLTNPGTLQVLCHTGGLAGSRRGYSLFLEDRASQNDAVEAITANGTDYVYTASSANNDAPGQTWAIVSAHITSTPNLLLECDGTNVDTEAQANTPSASDATAPFRLAQRDLGTFQFDGSMAEVIIYNGELTTDEIQDVTDYLGDRYNITVA